MSILRLILTLVLALCVLLANASLARQLASDQLQAGLDDSQDESSSRRLTEREGATPLVKQSQASAPNPFHQPGCQVVCPRLAGAWLLLAAHSTHARRPVAADVSLHELRVRLQI